MTRAVWMIACALVGCGGTIVGGLDGGGQDGGGTQDAAVDCNALAAQLQAEEPAAEQCCATCNSIQCTTQVDGLCCPLTVNLASSDAVKTYEATLKAFNDAKCLHSCPALACSTKPSSVCNGTGTNGTCQQ